MDNDSRADLPPLAYPADDLIDALEVGNVARDVLDAGRRDIFTWGADTPEVKQANTDAAYRWVKNRNAELRRSFDRRRAEGNFTRDQSYALATLDGACRDIVDEPKGGRNDLLNRKAFKLGGYVNVGLLDRNIVEHKLFEAAQLCNLVRDDGASAARGTIASGLDSAARLNMVPEIPERDDGMTIDYTQTASPRSMNDEDFWQSRESLRSIYTTALYRMCSPWAVLAHTAARALTLIRPNATLPPLIGGAGSLNWFAAIEATSGGGKGAAAATARILVPARVLTRNLGSGEGIIDAYVKPKEADQPRGFHESIMFMANEIDTMTALWSRNGSTLMGILRSGFSGETIGFSYRSNGDHLEAQTYRMTLVLSVQPALAGGLLDDHGGGTPQRFMWFPGSDKRITAQRPWPTGELTLPKPGEWKFPRELAIPAEAERLILEERAKAMRGEQDALDGHALFVREKFAYALTVLDGRVEMSSEDWQLAGLAMQMSDQVRQRVVEQLAEAAETDAAERGRLAGIGHQAADEEKAYRQAQRVNRIAAWIVKQLKASPSGLTEGRLRRQAQSRDRGLITHVLAQMSQDGQVKHDANTDCWTVPA